MGLEEFTATLEESGATLEVFVVTLKALLITLDDSTAILKQSVASRPQSSAKIFPTKAQWGSACAVRDRRRAYANASPGRVNAVEDVWTRVGSI
jgi:hypothetical protein